MRQNRWMLVLVAVIFAGFLLATLILVLRTFQPVVVEAQSPPRCSFPEDVTGDGRVNVVDIMLVASRLGADTFPPNYDQNFNGQVDLGDVWRVARLWQADCDSTSFDLVWGHYGDAILEEDDPGEDAEFRLPEGIDTSSVIDWKPMFTMQDGWQTDADWQLNSTYACHKDTVKEEGVFLTAPRVSLFDVSKPITLTFDYYLDSTHSGRAWLEISINGGDWVHLDPGMPNVGSYQTGSQSVTVDLSDYAFSIIQLRWGFTNTSCECGDYEECGDCCENFYRVQNVEIKGGIGAEDGMDELKPRVYVADTGNHRVQIFEYESDGTSVTYKGEFGYYGDGDGEFDLPEDVVVGPDALVYVADTVNHRIEYFDEDGSFQGQFGSYGDVILKQGDPATDARFNSPSGVAASAWHLVSSSTDGPQGDYFFLYVADTGNHRVQRFKIEKNDEEPKYDGEWGYYGHQDGQFNSPEGIDVDPIQTPPDLTGMPPDEPEEWEAHVYVADTNNHRVQFFRLDGTFEDGYKFGQYGDAIPSPGDTTGIEFNRPQDVAVGIRLEEGMLGQIQTYANRLVDVYVADTGNHRVQYLLWNDQTTPPTPPQHEYQDEFGYYGDASCEFNSQAGLAVDRLLPDDVGLEGDVFVADTWNHRCQRWSRPQ
ncbi:MAG: hypothetical protein WBW48_24975 [Anaerolineae bacterium]